MSTSMFDRFRRLRQHSEKAKLGYLASLPANYIDELDKESNQTLFYKFLNFLKQRLIYAFVFIPLLIVDCITTLPVALVLSVQALFSKSPEQKNIAEDARDHLRKNVLSLLFSWVGLIISPKLISFFFIENNINDHQMLSGGKLYERDVDLKVVSTENPSQEVSNILVNAQGRSVTVRGAGMSQGEQFLPKEQSDNPVENNKPIVIDLSKINHVDLLDPKKKIVRVGAGAKWLDIQNYANKYKMALKVMQASNIFSVGGSIGTNIHGWDHQNGTVANTIIAVTVVNAKGEINTYYRDKNPEFKQVFGTFGLMGIVTEVQLELTDNEKLYERTTEVMPIDYVKKFEEIKSDPKTRMHLYRLSLEQGKLLQSGLMVNYVKEDNDEPLETPNLTQEAGQGKRLERVGINLIRRSHFFQTTYWNYEKKRLLSQTDEQACQTTNEIMQPVINAMLNGSNSETEWLQEYFIPGDNLKDFLDKLGHLLDENNVHMINATVRFVKKDNISPLPYAPEDRFAVVICFNQVLKPKEVSKTERWVKLAANLALKSGGATYMPYQSFLSPKQYADTYGAENIESLMVQKKALDPNDVLSSGFYHKYLKTSLDKKTDNIFETLMSSEEAQTAFRGFLNNVLCRADADKFFTLLSDVISYSDTYEEVYQKMQARISECMPGTFMDLKNVLKSLSSIKVDLIKQASSLLGEKKDIDGMLEIGYPGRFMSEFQKKYTLTGAKSVMLEAESPTDYIQTGFPRPYDKAFTLDYSNPISSMDAYLEKAGENSVEVITCFVGLHHFPEDELEGFLFRLKRALKPGGHFLLVDHNIECEQDNLMAQLAHSVFNIITGETAENDINEIRNFQPMSYWANLCKKYDLAMTCSEQKDSSKAMIRDGDPSQNQMCGFEKPKAPLQLRALMEEMPEDDFNQEETLNPSLPKNPAEAYLKETKTQSFFQEGVDVDKILTSKVHLPDDNSPSP